jgi:hypothetical protein
MERGGLSLVNRRGDGSNHTEIRFKRNQPGGIVGLWSLGNDFDANGGQDFYLWDEVGSTNRFRINAQGQVSIGGLPAQDQLDVQSLLERGGITIRNMTSGNNAHSEIRFSKGQDPGNDGRWALGCDFEANGGQDFFLWDQVAGANRIVVNGQGKVGIGTDPPDNSSLYRLYVGDGIATRDVKVTAQANWPDYVFAHDYELMPLADLRVHLAKEKHLPGIPSAREVAANEGYEVGEMQARLLKVVEEQSLYILQLEARITALEQQRSTSK